MNDQIESWGVEPGSDSEGEILPSIGLSPRMTNQTITSRQILNNLRSYSKFQTRKQSMEIATQRLFESDYTCNKTEGIELYNQISPPFFMNKELKGKVVAPKYKQSIMNNFKSTVQTNNMRLQSNSNTQQQATHTTYSIQKLLKIRQKLRKSSILSQQLIKFDLKDINKSKRIENNTKIKTQPNYYEEKKTNRSTNNSPQKFQLLKSLKKGQIIRRRTFSRQQFKKGSSILSCRQTQPFNHKCSSTGSIKLNIEGVKFSQRFQLKIY